MFPDDILAEILQRLPLKPLFKFKCVSKGWNFLISEPSFKRSYELRSKSVGQITCGFFCYEWKEDYCGADDYVEYDDDNLLFNLLPNSPARFLKICDRYDQQMTNSFDFIDKLGHVIASCKGLLLLVTRDSLLTNLVPDYYVCDPITKKHHQLPPTLKQHRCASHGLLCEEGGNYKVVIFSNDRVDTHLLRFETFSSETRQWKESMISSPSRFTSKPSVTAGKVMGDVLYWLEDGGSKLLAYDPNDSKQCIKLIEVPLPGFNESGRIVYRYPDISETKEGYLQYFRSAYFIEIFVLNESSRSWYTKEEVIGHERWNLIHKIDIGNKLSIGPDGFVNCFNFHPLHSEILFIITTAMDQVLYSYDYSNEEIHRICSFDFSRQQFYIFYQHPLWPSLC